MGQKPHIKERDEVMQSSRFFFHEAIDLPYNPSSNLVEKTLSILAPS
jgi:hypothetical protein